MKTKRAGVPSSPKLQLASLLGKSLWVAGGEKLLGDARCCLPGVLTERFAALDKWAEKPAFGTPLEEHLKRSGREIALPIEACVMLLLETGMKEEVSGTPQFCEPNLCLPLPRVPHPNPLPDLLLITQLLCGEQVRALCIWLPCRLVK